MSRLTRIARLGIAALLGATAASEAAEWRRFDSEHFAFYTRREEATAIDLVRQLEYFHWLGHKYVGSTGPNLRSKARFAIYETEGVRELHTLFEKSTEFAGIYASCSEGAVAYTTPGKRDNGFISLGQSVMQHEYAHHLMYQYASVAYPSWFVEGFAEFLSQTAVESDRLVVGDINRWRLPQLNRGWLPMEDVLGWHRRSSSQREVDSASFYAQSWLLTHYLLADSDRAARLPSYFERLGKGEDPQATFESVFGHTMEELMSKLRQHLGRLPAVRIPLSALPASSVTSTALPADAQDYLLHESRLRSCAGKEFGQTILKQLRAHVASGNASPEARVALARAELLHGTATAARALLEPLQESATGNADVQYLLGRTWAKLAETLAADEQRDAWARARAALIQAYKLRRDDAPTLYHLARVLHRDGVDRNVLNAARAARVLAPTTTAYALLEVQVDLEADDRELAIRALGPLASNPHATEVTERARQAIDAIRAGKPTAEVMSLFEAKPKEEAKP